MKNICVVTSSRADYGILKPLLVRLKNEPDFLLSIAATGTHLADAFGFTCNEIENDGFVLDAKIDIDMSGESAKEVSYSMGKALVAFADYFSERSFDLLIVLGDRYEILAVCCAAVNQHIPIAHLHGGELTQGVLDDCYRHAITKLSNLHFTSTEVYRKRVIQLGETPETVFDVGALGVENALKEPLLSLAELEKFLRLDLSKRPFAVVTFHPVTLKSGESTTQMGELLASLGGFSQLDFIITKANADAGGSSINALWETFAKTNGNCHVFASLGMQGYLSALRYAKVMIGNSSSGILEGAAMKIPVVNIGDRQKGRLASANVINCEADRQDITRAIRKALTPEFQLAAQKAVNVYGDGNTSAKIVAVLKEYLRSSKDNLAKNFYDM